MPIVINIKFNIEIAKKGNCGHLFTKVECSRKLGSAKNITLLRKAIHLFEIFPTKTDLNEKSLISSNKLKPTAHLIPHLFSDIPEAKERMDEVYEGVEPTSTTLHHSF